MDAAGRKGLSRQSTRRQSSALRGKDTRKEYRSLREVFHQVRKGETLASIARKYGSAPRSLADLNGLTSPRLRVGQKLKIGIESERIAMR
ncbi:MAG: LysM peptidoglycan-binding domain-containing protein [Deltaproteobacteria bacterium]|nr:LysM peptidoglycan-binding domain-containing protein [Deltaproteobacteria bacterium]